MPRASLTAVTCTALAALCVPEFAAAQARVPLPERIAPDVLRDSLEPSRSDQPAPIDPGRQLAEAIARRPPPHPWLRARGRQMERRFSPDAFQTLASRVERDAAAAGLHTLRRYAAPPPQPMLAPFTPPDHQRGEANNWLNAPALFEGVVVRATYDADGRLSEARVMRSSGSPALDQLAIAELRREEPDMATPDDLLGDGPLVVDWLFEMAHVGVPLVETGPRTATPTLSFGIVADLADLRDGRVQAVVAGQGYVRTRIRCLGRVTEATPPAPVPPSEPAPE